MRGRLPQLRQIIAGCQEKHWKPLALFLFRPPVTLRGGRSIRGKKAEGKGERAAKTRRVLQVVQRVLPECPRERGARANHPGRGSVVPHSEPGFPWDAAERRGTKQIRLPPKGGRNSHLSPSRRAHPPADRDRDQSGPWGAHRRSEDSDHPRRLFRARWPGGPRRAGKMPAPPTRS